MHKSVAMTEARKAQFLSAGFELEHRFSIGKVHDFNIKMYQSYLSTETFALKSYSVSPNVDL